MSTPTPNQFDPHTPRGVDQAGQTRGASDRPPLNTTLTTALHDLAYEDGTSSARPNQRYCPVCECLHRHGLVTWTPGRWRLSTEGWAFIETRTLRPEETR